MADRRDYFFRQKVTEAELDAGFDGLELADRNFAIDQAIFGVLSGQVVTQHAGVADLTVDVTSGSAYDQAGQRCRIPSGQVVNCAVDFNAVSTTVSTPGNEKWLGLFLQFDRALSDPRVDGNSLTVQFVRAESFKFKVMQGAEAAIGLGVKVALQTDAILLADIQRLNAQTQILNSHILTSRRQDHLVIAGSPMTIRAGTVGGALSTIVSAYNNHIGGSADEHLAIDIQYAGGGTWVDGTTNPAATAEAQFDKIIADLAASPGATSGTGANRVGSGFVSGALMSLGGAGQSVHQILTALMQAANHEYLGSGLWADGTSLAAATVEATLDSIVSVLAATSGSGGAVKIGVGARTAWLGGRTNPSATLFAALDKIITDLAASAAGDDGAERIGAETVSGFNAGSVRSQLDQIGPAVAGTAYTAAKTFNGASGDTNATMLYTGSITNRKLIWESTGGAGGGKIRIYAAPTNGGTYEITVNALWGGSNFSADDTAQASGRVTINALGIGVGLRAAGAGTWTSFPGGLNITPSNTSTMTLSTDGVTGAVGAQDGIVDYCGDSGGANTFGGSSTFRAKFGTTPSSVTYSTTGLPADVNVTTVFAQANTTFRDHGLFVTGVATGAGATKHVRNFSVS